MINLLLMRAWVDRYVVVVVVVVVVGILIVCLFSQLTETPSECLSFSQINKFVYTKLANDE